MNLIIVESPTKAKTLGRFLGKDFVIEATMGHIKDLPKSKLGVDIEHNFKPDYVEVEKRKDSITTISQKAKKAGLIFLATDPDREGEAIAQHVREVLSSHQSSVISHQLKRIIFHEITKSAIEEALKNPKSIDQNLVNAQIARRVLDRLVGYKLSPLLWKKVRRGLSAGRVQTVAVKLIVEREREIEAFKPIEYWEIWASVKSDKSKSGQEFTIKLVKIGEKKTEVKNAEQAKRIVSDLNKSNYSVLDVRKSEVRKNPYPPFTTSTMTQAASRLFFWSANKTMNIAQKLYEEGLITYHRTDSTNLSKTAVIKLRKYIKGEYGDKYLPNIPRIYKTKAKVAQEAHEAIRPTNIKSKFQISNSKFSNDRRKLYELIWKRFVACQMSASIYDETVIDVLATQKVLKTKPSENYLLRASGQVMKFDGWRKLYSTRNDAVYLPEVKKGNILYLIKVYSEQKFTQPPARFTEASLIKSLEKLGIGRPSTYAPIITTIQIRNYVEKDEGKFKPTPVGIATNDFLIANFPKVFEYSFTASMEDNLDNVATGEVKWSGVIGDFWAPFEGRLESVEKKSKRVKIEAEKLGRKCKKCDKGELVVRIGRFGKFISCSRFPECDYTEKYIEKIGMKCPECKKGSVIVKNTSKGRKFYGCSRYPDCKWASWRNPKIQKNQEGDKLTV